MSVISLSSEDEDECCIIEHDGEPDRRQFRHEVVLLPNYSLDPDDNESETEILPEITFRETVCRKDTQVVIDPFADMDSYFISKDNTCETGIPMGEEPKLSVKYVVSNNQYGNVQGLQNGREYIRNPVKPIPENYDDIHEPNLKSQIGVNIPTEGCSEIPGNHEGDNVSKANIQCLAEYLVEVLEKIYSPNTSSEEPYNSTNDEDLDNVKCKSHDGSSREPQVKNNNITCKKATKKPNILNDSLSYSCEVPSDNDIKTTSAQTIPIKRKGRKVGWKKNKPLVVHCNEGEQFASVTLNKIEITEELQNQLNSELEQNQTTSNESDNSFFNSISKTKQKDQKTINAAKNCQIKKRRVRKRKILMSEEDKNYKDELFLQHTSSSSKSEKLVQKKNNKLISNSLSPKNKQVFPKLKSSEPQTKLDVTKYSRKTISDENNDIYDSNLKQTKIKVKRKEKNVSKRKRQFSPEHVIEVLEKTDPPNISSGEPHDSCSNENGESQKSPSSNSRLTKNNTVKSKETPVKNNRSCKKSVKKPKMCNVSHRYSHALPISSDAKTESKQIILNKSKGKRGRKVGWRKNKPLLVDCDVSMKHAVSLSLNKIVITEELQNQLESEQNGITSNESNKNGSNGVFPNEISQEIVNAVQNGQINKRRVRKRKTKVSEDNENKSLLQQTSRSSKSRMPVQEENFKLISDSSSHECKQVFKSPQDLSSDMLQSLFDKNFKNKISQNFKNKISQHTNQKNEILINSGEEINRNSLFQGNSKLKFTHNKCSSTVSLQPVSCTEKCVDQLSQNTFYDLSSEIPPAPNTELQEKVCTSSRSETMSIVQDRTSNLGLLKIKNLKGMMEKPQNKLFSSALDSPQMLLESLTNLSSDEVSQCKSEFRKYYKNVFNDNLENICVKMGDLLLLAVKEVHHCKLRVAKAGKFTCEESKCTEIVIAINSFEKTLQQYRGTFLKLFEQVYNPICNLTIPLEQQRPLIVAWFLKLFQHVTSLSPEFSDSLYEVKVNVLSLLPMKTLASSTVSVLLRKENEFKRDCMIVLNFMQDDCFDVNNKPGGHEKCMTHTNTSIEIYENNNLVESSVESISLNKPPNKCYLNMNAMNGESIQNNKKLTSPIGSHVDTGLANKLPSLNKVSVIVKDISEHCTTSANSCDLAKACNKGVKENMKAEVKVEIVGRSVVKTLTDSSVNTQNFPLTISVADLIGKEVIQEFTVESKQDTLKWVNNYMSSNSLADRNNIILANNHSSENVRPKNQKRKDDASVEQVKRTRSMEDFENYYRKHAKKQEIVQNRNDYNSKTLPDTGYSNPMPTTNYQYSVPYHGSLPPFNSLPKETNSQLMNSRSYFQRNEQLQNVASSYPVLTNHGNVCRTNQLGRNKCKESNYNSQQINPSACSYSTTYCNRNDGPNAVTKLHPSYCYANMKPPMFTNQYPQQDYISPYPDNAEENLISNSNQRRNNYENVTMNNYLFANQGNLEPYSSSINSGNCTMANANLIQYPVYNTGRCSQNFLNPDLQNKAGLTINNYTITNFLPSNSSDNLEILNNQHLNQYSQNNHSIERSSECSVVPEVHAKETIHHVPIFQSNLTYQTKEQ